MEILPHSKGYEVPWRNSHVLSHVTISIGCLKLGRAGTRRRLRQRNHSIDVKSTSTVNCVPTAFWFIWNETCLAGSTHFECRNSSMHYFRVLSLWQVTVMSRALTARMSLSLRCPSLWIAYTHLPFYMSVYSFAKQFSHTKSLLSVGFRIFASNFEVGRQWESTNYKDTYYTNQHGFDIGPNSVMKHYAMKIYGEMDL
jgi:hypothetical protein